MAQRSVAIAPVLQDSNKFKPCLNEQLWTHECLSGNQIILDTNED